MNSAKVRRGRLAKLTDLPNIGPAMAKDFELLGFRKPEQLKGRDPLRLYNELCKKTKTRQDPCVLDTFISVVRFMDGDKPKPWWFYTEGRKKMYRHDLG
jgi:Pathogenicity locus